MSTASVIRLGLAILACVGVLVLTILWNEVPAVIEPCSGGIPDDPSQQLWLGSCLRGPTPVEVALKLAISLLSIAGAAALVAKATPKRKILAGATAAALSALVGLTTLQAVSVQVFDVGYLPPVEEVAIVGVAFFLFGALVGWVLQRWWPNKLLERTLES